MSRPSEPTVAWDATWPPRDRVQAALDLTQAATHHYARALTLLFTGKDLLK